MKGKWLLSNWVLTYLPIYHDKKSILMNIDYWPIFIEQVETETRLHYTNTMEVEREKVYQERKENLQRICQEYNLTKGRVSEEFFSKNILHNHEYQVHLCM